MRKITSSVSNMVVRSNVKLEQAEAVVDDQGDLTVQRVDIVCNGSKYVRRVRFENKVDLFKQLENIISGIE
jgi:hypothetical protein